MALGKAIMLPHNMVDLATKDSKEFGGRLVMMGAQVCCSAHFVPCLSPFNA